MFRKQSPREKYFENQNSLTLFCLSLFLESSGQISRQSVKTTYPINSFKVDILCQNSSASFRSIKVCKKNKPPQEIMTPHQVASQSSTEFRGKSIALQTRFRLRCCDRARWGKWRKENVKINQENGKNQKRVSGEFAKLCTPRRSALITEMKSIGLVVRFDCV